jgi:transposase
MIIALHCVGCDVSKRTLDIFDEAIGSDEQVDNTPDAACALASRWSGRDVFVVFEATGGYDRHLCAALVAAGVRFARVNPQRARDFARACGKLAKTDAIDARVLAAFARAMAPRPADPVPHERRTLAQLAKRRDQLVQTRAEEKNRRSEWADPGMVARIERHIAFLDEEIEVIEAEIADAIAADPGLDQAARLLRSAPGVGPVAATQLLSLMPELGQTGPKEIASLAGLAPFNVDSGAFRGQRTIKGGRKRVRDALYMSALNAVRRAGPLKAFYERLRGRGRPAKVALIAVARKLLTMLNAMIRDQKPYQSVPTA